MLSKIRVGFQISLTKAQLENRGFGLDKDSKGQELEIYNISSIVSAGTWSEVTYNSPNYQFPLLMLQYELSLPKMGSNNVRLISNEEKTSATKTQRQARSSHYRPGTSADNTREEDNYLMQKYTIEVFPVKSLAFRNFGYVIVGFSAIGAKE